MKILFATLKRAENADEKFAGAARKNKQPITSKQLFKSWKSNWLNRFLACSEKVVIKCALRFYKYYKVETNS